MTQRKSKKIGSLWFKTTDPDNQYDTIGIVYEGRYPGKHDVSFAHPGKGEWARATAIKFSDDTVIPLTDVFVKLTLDAERENDKADTEDSPF